MQIHEGPKAPQQGLLGMRLRALLTVAQKLFIGCIHTNY